MRCDSIEGSLWTRDSYHLATVIRRRQAGNGPLVGNAALAPPGYKTVSRSLSVVSEARVSKLHKQARCVCALSIQRLEGSRPRLRRTRALCKFNGGTERCGGARRLCRSAPYKAPCANNLATAKKYVEERG